MPVIIQDECVGCAACVGVCEPDCIHEDDDLFFVDNEHCTGCAKCLPACPVNCIIQV